MSQETLLPRSLRINDLPKHPRILAVDLAADPAHRPLWKPVSSRGTTPVDDPGLPRPGFATPMGFWLTEAAVVPRSDASTNTIHFEAIGSPTPEPSPPEPGRPRRPEQTVRLKAPHVGDGDLVLKISSAGVRIQATEAGWKALSEPVLLAIGQYWRFLAIEAELDRLTEAARLDLDHATSPTLATLRARRSLVANARDVRTLLLDLPYFEGPLNDPYPYCSTELSGQTFLALAEKLRLEEWCEYLDERAEAVEDTYEAATEKLLEFRNFAWEAILEILIVFLLLGELGLTLWEMFGPG